MRKIIVLTVVLSIVLSLFGCGSDTQPSKPETTTPTVSEATDPTQATQPSQPSQPQQPQDPTQPTQPSDPSQPTQPTEPESPTPTDPEGTQPGESVVIPQKDIFAISLVPITTETTAQDGTVIFTQTYQTPEILLPEPGVANKILLDLEKKLTLNENDIANAISTAQQIYNSNPSSWTPHIRKLTYAPKRFDSGVLSLFGVDVRFSGGSHSDPTGKSVSYDLLTGGTLTLENVLCENTSASVLTPLIIESLASQNYQLFPDYESTVTDSMETETSQIKNWYFTENGLCFYYNPYDIGSFVSGIITAEIPYSKLTQILKDEYFPAEMDTVDGIVNIAPFTGDDSFTQYAELILDNQGTTFLLYTDKAVTNMQIYVGEKGKLNANNPDKNAVAFRIYTLTPGDAVTVAVDFSTTDLLISYQSGDEIIIKTVTLTNGQVAIS